MIDFINDYIKHSLCIKNLKFRKIGHIDIQSSSVKANKSLIFATIREVLNNFSVSEKYRDKEAQNKVSMALLDKRKVSIDFLDMPLMEFFDTIYLSKNIDVLIGASLGAFYVLQYKDTIDKLVINPCLYPSIEIPKLKDRATGNPIILSNKVLSDFREMEKYEDIPETQKPRTFGIFAKDDELFHFKDSFDKLFYYKECYYPNSILINGHHSIEEEFLTDGLQQAEKYFEDRAMTCGAV